MADDLYSKPETQAGVTAPELSLPASANAPFVYFESASNYGCNNGVAHVTLEANRALSIEGKVVTDRVIVAHLRMSVPAAMSLRAALNGIALLVTPQAGRADH